MPERDRASSLLYRDVVRAAAGHLGHLYESVGGVQHDGEKGAFREFFLSAFIRPLLPHHFGVGAGIIVDAYGRQSKQTDLIIYDRRQQPPVFLAGDRGVFPIDGVLAAVEVKSCVRASDYSKAADAARRLSGAPDDDEVLRITPDGESHTSTTYPLCALFAYRSDADKDESVRLEEQCASGRRWLRAIGVDAKGVWITPDDNGPMQVCGAGREHATVEFFKLLMERAEKMAQTRGGYRPAMWL